MITREQVADLQPGDVVELTPHEHSGVVVRGPLHQCGTRDRLQVGTYIVRCDDGTPFTAMPRSLTVVSRAPRPLYVNHPRTEPVPGDVVRDEDGKVRHCQHLRAYDQLRWWGWDHREGMWLHTGTDSLRQPLTLLVDGTTGQVVPS